jgi:hypothetical protein
MITLGEVRIHAHICGDGYNSISTQRRNKADMERHPRKSIFRKRYRVGYSNTEKILIESFGKDVMKTYCLKICLLHTKNEAIIQAKWVFDRLRKMGTLGSHTWFIASPSLL